MGFDNGGVGFIFTFAFIVTSYERNGNSNQTTLQLFVQQLVEATDEEKYWHHHDITFTKYWKMVKVGTNKSNKTQVGLLAYNNDICFWGTLPSTKARKQQELSLIEFRDDSQTLHIEGLHIQSLTYISLRFTSTKWHMEYTLTFHIHFHKAVSKTVFGTFN